MKASETEIRFKTGFQEPKTGFAIKPVLTSLHGTNVYYQPIVTYI